MSTTPPNSTNTDTPPSGRLPVIPGTDNGCPDRKTLYIKVAQNRPTITDMIPIPPPHPSNLPNIEPPPPDRQPDELSGTATVPGSIYFEHESCSE